MSSSHNVGIISPLPEEPPDPGLEALTTTGLTPAQAYQAQVYLNSPAGPQGDRSQYPPPADRNSHPQVQQNGGPSRAPDAPIIGLAFDQDDGRLGLDFGGDNNSSDQGTEESSELPWVRRDRTGEFHILVALRIRF